MGITGQDWAYLAEFLLDKGYEAARHQETLLII
jgi:GDP-D-mannose dehydratase